MSRPVAVIVMPESEKFTEREQKAREMKCLLISIIVYLGVDSLRIQACPEEREYLIPASFITN